MVPAVLATEAPLDSGDDGAVSIGAVSIGAVPLESVAFRLDAGRRVRGDHLAQPSRGKHDSEFGPRIGGIPNLTGDLLHKLGSNNGYMARRGNADDDAVTLDADDPHFYVGPDSDRLTRSAREDEHLALLHNRNL
jgi:hypothetical protein